jgi:D-glycero-D-manno-heptose 1,7-bisphosphate phosphatase
MQKAKNNSYTVKPALCLDFDGTIRHHKDDKPGKKPLFIEKPADIALFPGVEEKVWQYRLDKNFLILGISNQGGVAFGYKTVEQINQEIEFTLSLFSKNPFHLVKTAFNHPKGNTWPFNNRSLLRKPHTGMLAACEAEMFAKGVVIDWDNSIFVGDRQDDLECARLANIKFIWAAEFFSL